MPEKNHTTSRLSSLSATKDIIKKALGEVPLTAEIYWLLRNRSGRIASRFSLAYLDQNLSEMCTEVKTVRKTAKPGKKIFIFSSLHIWLHHAAILGLGMAADGHEVNLGFLPYSDWFTSINRFDLRRQNLYAQRVLRKASPWVKIVPFLSMHSGYKSLPRELEEKVNEISRYDTQYTDQVEVINPQGPVYKLRISRNLSAARTAYAWMLANHPDVVIVPNGTILEFGVIYEVARFLKIPAITYEFSDQQQRIWLAQNAKVMRQDTDDLWHAFADKPLTANEQKKIEELFEARKKASVWKNFSRLWQSIPAEGVQLARAKLNLDDRAVVLLATNVLGDSLTLGRQIFSNTMQDWIERTVQYFVGRTDTQLVIRVHPGEVLTHGVSMVNVVNHVLPKLPEQIHLIRPEENINTYDLIAAADVGLVYTTTVGLEMAMSGIPVIVSGDTHYRDRGFTYDPQSWLKYFKILGTILNHPQQFHLTKDQIKKAWAYAYRFFFDFPRPFPWHLHNLKNDYQNNPIRAVFSDKGRKEYGMTFAYLAGEPLDWEDIATNHG